MSLAKNTMTDYLLIFRGESPESQELSETQRTQHFAAWGEWIGQLNQSKNFKAGEPLKSEGKTIGGRSKKVTEGPYASGEDFVGGYLLIAAESLDEAVELSRDCPILSIGGSVEVRPVAQM